MKLTLVLPVNRGIYLVLIPFQNMFENLQWFLIFQFIFSVDVLSCMSLYKEKVKLSLAYEFLKRNSLGFCLFSFLFQVKNTNVVSISQERL